MASETGYAPIGDLQMYYEIHGSGGRPLVLLHGAYMIVDIVRAAARGARAGTRRVIVPEMQGHGRTADIDRAITYEQMADDTAALIAHLSLEQPDVAGYSMGAGVALQLGMRHHGVARKLVAASASFASAGIQPEAMGDVPLDQPGDVRRHADGGRPTRALRRTPTPSPALVSKLKTLDTEDVHLVAGRRSARSPRRCC